MCFSPEADIVSGVAIGALAVDTLRHHPARENLPLAMLPAVFAAHGLIEAFVWFAGRGQVSDTIGTPATYAYLTIAFGVLPTLLPYAVRAREPSGVRRNALTLLLFIGLAVSATLLWATFNGPVTATLHDHFIRYRVGIPGVTLVTAACALATCAAALLSSSREIVAFGVLNVVAVSLLAWLNVGALTSLWCGWAAIASLAIVLMVRKDGKKDSPPRRVTVVRP
ncbi:MAG: hypothetical protein M3Q98_00630 [Actinomycetota bacterium]|nr:hypothetical protein [Actinomycetota bacterium]